MRLGFLIAGLLLAAGAAAQLAVQKNGVTIAVKPAELGPGATSWDFSVVLDTHSQDLSDDLAKSVVLVDEKGREYRPFAWEGAAPGGHHRKGVLKFAAVSPQPQSLELRISRPGEAKPRVFRWDLK